MIQISRAASSDLPRILGIQKEAYLSEAAIYDDYSLMQLHETIADVERDFAQATFFKAVIDHEIVGSVRATLREHTCLIGRLMVDPRFQKRGIGSALLAQAEGVFVEANEAELFTGSKSVSNLRFYARHGYTPFGEKVISPRVTVVCLRKILAERTPRRACHVAARS